MFKITNAQASAFTSPTMAKLFNDENRQFPIEDAFKLSDMIQQIQTRLEPYMVSLRKIINMYGGIVADNGIVTYPNNEQRVKAEVEVNKLNAIEVEYPGDLLTPSEGWPKLTLAEATILKPILNGKTNQQ